MAHLIEGDIQAYLDGELDPGRRAEVDRHLAACAECAAELFELRQAAVDFAHAVAVLDSPVSLVREFVPRRRRSSVGVLAWARGAMLRAAAVLLLVSGVAWGALPGSPVRAWLGQVWIDGSARLAGRGGAELMEPAAAAASQGGPTVSGISLLPLDGEARVLLREIEAATRLRVRLVDSAQVTVQWTGVGAGPHYRTAPGRVEVLHGGPGALLIEAPRASHTVIEVDGRIVAIVEGGVLRALVAAESTGDDLVFPTLQRGG